MSSGAPAPRLFVPPPHGRGQRIGLFGGSFNPAHAGHLHVSLVALRRLRLDAVWWLVSPGNPLKDNRDLPPLDRRMAAARALARHPRIAVTGIEAALGLRYTADLVETLKRRCPGVHFVWIMGADNLAQFHRWKYWARIAAAVPIAVVDRPGAGERALRAPFAVAFAGRRLDEAGAARLALARPPAWVFLHGPRSPLSSTMLRALKPARSDRVRPPCA
jgi:nicotinate-nucleotide adenylyltransferase